MAQWKGDALDFVPRGTSSARAREIANKNRKLAERRAAGVTPDDGRIIPESHDERDVRDVLDQD